MTAIRPMQRRERAIVGGRYLNSAYGMPAASSLASRRSSNHLRNIACVQPVCPLLPMAEQLFGNNWRLTDSIRSEEHTSELQSLMRISYAVFSLKHKTYNH